MFHREFKSKLLRKNFWHNLINLQAELIIKLETNLI